MKKLISILMMLTMLGMVNGLYWSEFYDSDQDGINDFNLMGNDYYIDSPEGCSDCVQWYWCQDNSVWSLKDGVDNAWEVEECLDYCHSGRTYQTSAMDPSKFVDVTWCGSEVAYTDVSDCPYPYGGEQFCGGLYGLNPNMWYSGYCSYYQEGGECQDCYMHLIDDIPVCMNMDWAYCLDERTWPQDEGYELVYYSCDYSPAGDCSDVEIAGSTLIDTIQVYEATSTLEEVKNACLAKATMLTEATKRWYFENDICACVFRAPHTGDLTSYDNSAACMAANQAKIDNKCTGLVEIPMEVIIGGIVIIVAIAAVLILKDK